MEKINYYCKALSQELRLLERIVYKFKNQHGRLGYFRSIFRVTKELRLFCIGLRETFYNKNSTENAENYYKNLRDLRRVVRRIKWDLKDAGMSISRLLSHGFFLPMVFLLICTCSRLYSVIINIKLTIDCIIPAVPFKPSSAGGSSGSLTASSHAAHNEPRDKSSTQARPRLLHPVECFDEEDLGEVVSHSPVSGSLGGSGGCHKESSRESPVGDGLLEPESNKSDSTPVQTTDEHVGIPSPPEDDEPVHLGEHSAGKPTLKKRSRVIQAWTAHTMLRSKLRKLKSFGAKLL